MTENAQEYLAGLQKTVAVSALIEKAMAAKKALESQNAIVERVAHQRSEFAKAFGTTSIDTAPVLSHL